MRNGGKKVGAGTVKKGPISTVQKDCIVPVPKQGGSWGGTKNGADTGPKSSGGQLDEVTTVDVGGAKVNQKVTSSKIANR